MKYTCQLYEYVLSAPSKTILIRFKNILIFDFEQNIPLKKDKKRWGGQWAVGEKSSAKSLTALCWFNRKRKYNLIWQAWQDCIPRGPQAYWQNIHVSMILRGTFRERGREKKRKSSLFHLWDFPLQFPQPTTQIQLQHNWREPFQNWKRHVSEITHTQLNKTLTIALLLPDLCGYQDELWKFFDEKKK